jgi:hypothetical protein
MDNRPPLPRVLGASSLRIALDAGQAQGLLDLRKNWQAMGDCLVRN